MVNENGLGRQEEKPQTGEPLSGYLSPQKKGEHRDDFRKDIS